MKYFFHVTIVLILFSGGLLAQEVNFLDFRHSNHLKVVFDSGLHPRHVARLEKKKCEIKDANLKLHLPESRPFHFYSENAVFSVLENDEIYTSTFTGYFEEIDSAVEIVKDVSNAVGMPVGDLNSLVQEIKSNPSSGTTRYWSNRISKNEIRVHLVLSPIIQFDQNSPNTDYRNVSGAKLNLTIGWNKYPIASIRSRSNPIKPPDGYSHLSMEPLPVQPTKPMRPEKSFNELTNESKATYSSNSSPSSQSGVQNKSSTAQEATAEVEQEPASFPWLWIGAIVVIAGVVAFLVIQRQRT